LVASFHPTLDKGGDQYSDYSKVGSVDDGGAMMMIRVALAAVVTLLGTAPVLAQQTYRVTEVGHFGNGAWARGMNAAGDVVGYAWSTA
jgi:hypothetical protein